MFDSSTLFVALTTSTLGMILSSDRLRYFLCVTDHVVLRNMFAVSSVGCTILNLACLMGMTYKLFFTPTKKNND
jgi:hypothetical protein